LSYPENEILENEKSTYNCSASAIFCHGFFAEADLDSGFIEDNGFE
jgi:hypothetical protein